MTSSPTPAVLPDARAQEIAIEMAAFEAAFPLCDHTKYRDGEVIAGRSRYAEPEIDKMFSAWLSACAVSPELARLRTLREAVLILWGDSRAWGDDATVTHLAGKFQALVTLASGEGKAE